MVAVKSRPLHPIIVTIEVTAIQVLMDDMGVVIEGGIMKDMVVGVANMAANTNNTAIEHLTGNTTIGRLDGTVIVNNNRSARITTVVAIAHDMVVIVVRLVRPFNNSWEALWTISNGATPTIHATHQVIMDRCGTISNNIATITDTIVGRGRNRTSSQLLISTKRKTKHMCGRVDKEHWNDVNINVQTTSSVGLF